MATFGPGADTALAVQPLGALGAEIIGLGFPQALEPETILTVHNALTCHGLVYFPNKRLSHDERDAFSRQIGPFGDNPFVEAVSGRPNLVEVRRDHKGAVLLFDTLPNAKELQGDKGYDSDWFRSALAARGIAAPLIVSLNQ